LIHHATLKRLGEHVDADYGEVRIKSVPFESEKLFYEYYVQEVPESRCVGRSCFDNALKSFSTVSLQHEAYFVRMRRCKHKFSTCDICNNGQALLQDKARRWAPGQKRILEEYLNVHYKIQQSEREEQARAIGEARQLDSLGQPKQAFMLFDGFSVYKGVTPKWGRGSYGGKSHTEKEAPKVENRVIAGVVICGMMDTVFVYTVDQLTRGGANLMIEVISRALSDLGEL